MNRADKEFIAGAIQSALACLQREAREDTVETRRELRIAIGLLNGTPVFSAYKAYRRPPEAKPRHIMDSI